jgi:hypothetical protein
VATAGTLAVELVTAGCGPQYDGWEGCDQAEILPGVNYVGPSINARLEAIDKAEGTHTELKGGMRDTNKAALKAFQTVYQQVYGEKRVVLQTGDVVPFCVNDSREVSFDHGGEILVKDHRYSFTETDGQWQAASK